MQKIIIFFFLLSTLLPAKEPMIAILVNIISNELQEFRVGNYQFTCSPYGVLTLDKLYNSSKSNKTCKKLIYDFYEKQAELLYYAQRNLSVKQSYSIVIKNNKCLISLDGEKSYPEFLLEEGIAIKIPAGLDKEYDYLFYKSQREARASKIGLWNYNISQACMSSIYIRR